MNKNPLDPYNFRQMILETPNQFAKGFEIAKNIQIKGDFDSFTVSGMGGSALYVNILRIYLSDLLKTKKTDKHINLYQNRFYTLPPEAYKNSLNIISSYSGNTEETISSFEEALKNNLPCIGLSSGGRIEEMCKTNNIPHIKLPIPFENFQPRIATGYFFAALLQLLINQKLAPDTAEEILTEVEKIKLALPELEKRGKELATLIQGKTPVIHSSLRYKALAMVWKIKFNENSKTPAFWNFFPELNHNEMIGYTHMQGKFFIISLKDPEDHPRSIKRIDITADLLRKNGADVEIITLEGNNAFYKLSWALTLGEFTSYYLALGYNQDPTPVDLVEKFKKLMEE